jgi:hypothetical protein
MKPADIEDSPNVHHNPFAELAVFLPPIVMQVYIALMIFAVAIGTLFDMLQSAAPDSSCSSGRNHRPPPRRSTAWTTLRWLPDVSERVAPPANSVI